VVERVFAIRVGTPADAVKVSEKNESRPKAALECAGEDLNLHDRNGH
jgi:hypothetical protein